MSTTTVNRSCSASAATLSTYLWQAFEEVFKLMALSDKCMILDLGSHIGIPPSPWCACASLSAQHNMSKGCIVKLHYFYLFSDLISTTKTKLFLQIAISVHKPSLSAACNCSSLLTGLFASSGTPLPDDLKSKRSCPDFSSLLCMPSCDDCDTRSGCSEGAER